MADTDTPGMRDRLVAKIADSLTGPILPSTPRRVHGRIALPAKATAVIGMRRAGKTTFMHQLRRDRLAAGIARDRLPFVSFEDEQLAGFDAAQLGLLLDEYYRLCPGYRHTETVTWCLDEIQVVPGWERFVRRVLDSESVEVFLSGSSAALLSRELATSMRGRSWEVVIHPFSFAEVLSHRGDLPAKLPPKLTSRLRSQLEAALIDYLGAGGFPEAQGLDPASRHKLLRDYVDVAMLRDVVERHAVTNVVGLRWLVRHVLANAAGAFTVEKFHAGLRSQGIAISKDTLHQLLAHLEDCFLVRTLWIESESERRRMVNPRKLYPIDPGLIPIFDRSGRTNIGHALETVVMLELERRGASLTYVKTESGYEVDFFARFPGGDTELIQVAADASDDSTAARELRALVEAGVSFPGATQRLLVLTQDAQPRSAPRAVSVQPVYEWLLEPPSDTG